MNLQHFFDEIAAIFQYFLHIVKIAALSLGFTVTTLVEPNCDEALLRQSFGQMSSHASVHSHRMKDEDDTLGLRSTVYFSKGCQFDGFLILTAMELHEIFLRVLFAYEIAGLCLSLSLILHEFDPIFSHGHVLAVRYFLHLQIFILFDFGSIAKAQYLWPNHSQQITASHLQFIDFYCQYCEFQYLGHFKEKVKLKGATIVGLFAEIHRIACFYSLNYYQYQILFILLGLLLYLFIILFIPSANRLPMEGQSHSDALRSSQPIEESPGSNFVGEEEHLIVESPKNRRWTEEQHMLFIMFLEENRQRIKSKLIRRSNSFFREMAAFISTKNPTQCRSYHQKYENKYKFPHRIIRQEKQRLDMSAYEQMIAKRKSLLPPAGLLDQSKAAMEDGRGRARREKPEVRVCECQTDIQGVSTVLIQPQAAVRPQQAVELPHGQPFVPNYPFLATFFPPYYQW